MNISMIWAQSRSGLIGSNNTIPWHLPEDLKHFSELTKNSTVVMGKSTWLSLPNTFKPLPLRKNIVLSKDKTFEAEGAVIANSIEQALIIAEHETDLWFIGGQKVYESTISLAERIEVTLVDVEVTGDTYAPPIPANMLLGSDLDDWKIAKNGIRYRFDSYFSV